MSVRQFKNRPDTLTQSEQSQKVVYPEGFSLAKETVKGLPKAAGDVAQSFARGTFILPGYISAGLGSIGATAKSGKPTFVEPEFNTEDTKLSRFLFGDKPFTATKEIVETQDAFRDPLNPSAGKATAATPLVGGLLAAADLPTGGGASQTFRAVSRALKASRRAAVSANKASDAIRILRAANVSDDVVRSLNLDKRIVSATTEAEVETIFDEAAKAQDAFVRSQSKKQRAQTTREQTQPRTDTQKQPTRVFQRAPEDSPAPKGPEAVREQARQQTIDKADEARFIREEVMPKQERIPLVETGRVSRETQTNVLNRLTQQGRDNVGFVVDTVRVGDGIVTEQMENNFRTIAGTLGLNTDKALKALVKDMEKVLKQNPEIAQRIRPADDYYWQQTTKTPDYLRRNRQAGFAGVPDGFKKRKQTEAAQTVARDADRSMTSDELITPDTTATKAPRQPVSPQANPDDVIAQASQKYEAVKNIGLGDTEMARMAQRAPAMGGMQLASDLLTPISSRLGRINPKLKFALRKFESTTRRKTTERMEKVLPLMDSTKRMTRSDRAVFDLALKNGDETVIDAFAKKYNIQKELDDARAVLDEIFTEAESVGLEVAYRKAFFPRQVKNPTAFSQYLRGREDWGSIRAALEEKAEQLGKKFTDLTDDEIAGMTNNLLRGYGSQTTLAKPGQLKARTIEELGTELNKFYENSNTALLTYVHKLTDEIEGRRFFGKTADKDAVVKNPNTGEVTAFNTEDSIGAYVTKLIADGDITVAQQDEVTKILQARFKKGNMNGMVAGWRDLEYISTMGNPISAITQIGDLAFALYKNGWYNTLRGIAGTVTRRNPMTKESMGVERIGQEFDNPAKTAKALEKVFKWVGMNAVDRLGKETLLEGSRLKMKQRALKNDPDLIADLNYMFDDIDALKALEQLKNGDITDLTKEVHLNTLMDFQPIAKSEMPVKYLEMPNGRIFYMLKSFTLKQFDVFRREAIDTLVSKTATSKQRAVAARNLIYLSGVFMLANATADEIKDFVLGRETSLKDRTIDNIFRLFGASKYDVYNSRERGVGFAVLQRILPPLSLFDRLSTDASRLIEGKEYKTGPLEGERYGSEAVQSIPGGGKLYYWWFGRGAQKQQYSTRGEGAAGSESGRVRSFTRESDSGSGRVREFTRN